MFDLTHGKMRKYFCQFVSIFFISLSIFLLFLAYSFFLRKHSFQKERIINIKQGENIHDIAKELGKEKLIFSPSLLSLYFRFSHKAIKSGYYRIPQNFSDYQLAEKLARADFGDIYTKFTFPEGSTKEDLLSLLEKEKLNLKRDKLKTLLQKKDEGTFFPDTYFLEPEISEEDFISRLEQRFQERFQKAKQGTSLKKSDHDVLVMASLIEKEAGKSLKEKQMISGILWKRLAKGIPLQVDAPFLYERGKGSSKLSRKDLKKDSLFNTYTRKGLPPHAIGNPGYDALYAAFHPIESPYYFYLHAKDGKIHYAKTYYEHLKNKKNYLN